jgi:hypothetical protein
LIAPSRGRKDADHKSGGPRYALPQGIHWVVAEVV